VATHVKVIAVLYLVFGLFRTAAVFFLPLILGFVAAIVGRDGDPDAGVATAVLGFTGVALSVFFIATAIPMLITGWGLLKLKPWARIAGIVMGVLCLISVPLGTVLGIYALVILFRKDTEALFVAR
jgi:hypothetical protein